MENLNVLKPVSKSVLFIVNEINPNKILISLIESSYRQSAKFLCVLTLFAGER